MSRKQPPCFDDRWNSIPRTTKRGSISPPLDRAQVRLQEHGGADAKCRSADANGRAVAATGQPGKALGQFGEAHYLTVSPRGEIYVADTMNAVLHKFVKK